MFTGLTSMRSLRLPRRLPQTQRRRGPRPASTIEGLEGRVLFAFNAYIAGDASAAIGFDSTYILSTTGQAAKQWVIDWGEPDTPTTTITAPNQTTGFTSPVSVIHHNGRFGDHSVTATATSVTNVTATAALALNATFGPGVPDQNGVNVQTGKTVQGLADAASTGTGIVTVADDDNTSYVLSIDGKRMAITRFKPDGTIDGGTTGWTTSGTYVLPAFTTSTNQDTPKAMTIDKTRNLLYVAGVSNNKWAVARINIDAISTVPVQWQRSILTGSANAVWWDISDMGAEVAFAGTSSAGEVQVTVLYAIDTTDDTGFHAAGTTDTAFATSGVATVPNTVWGIPGSPISVTASAAALVEADDDPLVGGDEEFYVAATVTYCCAGSGGVSGSNMAIVDILSTGGTNPDPDWGNGSGATPTFNFGTSCAVGNNYESAFALVPSTVGGTRYLTVAGNSNSQFLTARYTQEHGLLDTTAYGPLVGGGPTRKGYAYGPSGTAYAAVLDKGPNKVVVSGTTGADFLAARFNDDGTLDSSFGQSGVIRVDFGSTSGITTDGGRSIAMRSHTDPNTGNTTYDILVAGYVYDSATAKYTIGLVDLLDDNSIFVV